jgi:hypothetical protein
MALQDLWYSREATVKMGQALTAVNTTESLETQFNASASGSDYSGRCKEVRLTGGTFDVEVMHLFGDNQAMEEKRPELKSAEFTLIYQDEEIGELAYGTGIAIGSTGYNRVQGADISGCRTKRSLLFKLADCAASGEQINILMNNSYVTDREISLAQDGSVEETLTAKCIIMDYYEEYKAGS